MAQDSEFIWMDGELIKYADAKVHVLSHSLHYIFSHILDQRIKSPVRNLIAAYFQFSLVAPQIYKAEP